MENRYRVLGIAPYEGMKKLMSDLVEDYPEIDLTLFVGDLEEGLEIAHSNFHGSYDVVISRGGTAKMLRRNLPLPVVEIPVSMYDLLCSLKLAGASARAGKVSMVAFDNITANARLLCNLLDYDIDIRTVDDGPEAEAILAGMQQDCCEAILCDAVSNAAAKRLGFNSFLITSGPDSIRQAFEQALFLCRNQTRLREENLFFRELLHGQIGQTIVLDDNGHLYLSTLEHPSQGLLDLLKRELPESRKEEERRIIRNLDGMLYSIRSRRATSGSLSRTAFFFAARKSPLSPNQAGIRFSTRPETEAAFYSSIFSFAGTIRDFQDDIDRISRSSAPVMVTGEDGTGKESIVSVLYLRGTLQNNPLVSVNCSLLNEKSWDFLLENHHSPLADEDITIYFSSIDALSPERRQQLLAVLSEMDVCRRNRVIFSCVCQPGEYTSAAGSLFMDKLCCLSLFLPPFTAAVRPDPRSGEPVPQPPERRSSPAAGGRGTGGPGTAAIFPVAAQLHPVPPGDGSAGGHRRRTGDHRTGRTGHPPQRAACGHLFPRCRERRRPPGSEPSPGGDHAGGGAVGSGGKRRQPDRGVQTAGDQQDHPVATAAKVSGISLRLSLHTSQSTCFQSQDHP